MRTSIPTILLAITLAAPAFLVAQAPQVTRVGRWGPDPATAAVLPFLVEFDQPVQGVDASDFQPVTTLPGVTVNAVGNRGLDPESRVIVNPMQGFPTTAFTVELWVKTGDGAGTMLSYAISNAMNREFSLRTPNGLVVVIHDEAVLSSGVAIHDDQWHHVAVTWLSLTGEVTLYVDGIVVGTATAQAGTSLQDGGSFVLGQNQANLASAFNGVVQGTYDELRVWNYRRIPAEILADMNRSLRGDESGLVLYWPLDALEDLGSGAPGGDEIRDHSPNQNHGVAQPGVGSIEPGAPTDGTRWRVDALSPSGLGGTVALDVLADGSIMSLGGVAMNAAFTAGETYSVQSAGTTLLVPGEFATISDAIAAASHGTTILISPGTYFENNINLMGKAVTLRGVAGAAQTIIDAQSNGRVVTINSGEGRETVIEGLTLRGGLAADGNPGGPGGGLLINGSSPTVTHCIIEDNEAGRGNNGSNMTSNGSAGRRGGSGGGLCVESGAPLIRDCIVRTNRAGRGGNGGWDFGNGGYQGGAGGRGGGICVTSGAPLFHRCHIEGNLSGRGGNAFTGTLDPGPRGGHSGIGGGVAVLGGTPVFQECRIEANETNRGGFGIANGADGGNGGRGGGVRVSGGSALIISTVIAGNMTGVAGTPGNNGQPGAPGEVGGVDVGPNGVCQIINSVIYGNIGATEGPVLGPCSLRNTVVRANVPAPLTSGLVIANSLIEGGDGMGAAYPGAGNFLGDPLFADEANGDFHLLAGSPCIDAGSSDPSDLGAFDLDGDNRWLGALPDVGVDEVTALPPYPSLGDDLELTSLINGLGDPLAQQKAAGPDDVITLGLASPSGSYHGLGYLVLGQVFTTGATPVGFFPGLYVASPGFAILVDSSTLLGLGFTPVLTPGGVTLQFLVPPGLAGNSLMLQGIVVSPQSTNGLFAPTAGHEIRLY